MLVETWSVSIEWRWMWMRRRRRCSSVLWGTLIGSWSKISHNVSVSILVRSSCSSWMWSRRWTWRWMRIIPSWVHCSYVTDHVMISMGGHAIWSWITMGHSGCEWCTNKTIISSCSSWWRSSLDRTSRSYKWNALMRLLMWSRIGPSNWQHTTSTNVGTTRFY